MLFHIRLFLTLPLALITLLVLRSEPAYAEWVVVSGNDEAGLTVYVDPNTIRRKGNLVKMWYLLDYKTVQTATGDSHLSAKVQNEYDCTEDRSRVLSFWWFSGNMGNGKVVFNNSNEGKWSPVPPESVGEALWKVACDKK